MLVYLDLVMLLNFAVDFLLILGTNRLSGFPPGCGRAAVGAGIGSVYAAACMFPEFRFLWNPHWRVVSLLLIASAAFGWSRSALRRCAMFILLNMALGGIASGTGCGDIWGIGICAGLLALLCGVGFRGSQAQREYVPAQLCWQDRKVNLIALKDTGNTLRDPITGEQVLVCGADVGESLLGLSRNQFRDPIGTLATGMIPGLRLVTYRAVGQPSGMLLALRLNRSKIGNESVKPLVAFAPEEIAKGEVYQMLTGGTI